jgi:hypothetical protein
VRAFLSPERITPPLEAEFLDFGSRRPGRGAASTSQGHTLGPIFKRAIEKESVVIAEATARELGQLLVEATFVATLLAAPQLRCALRDAALASAWPKAPFGGAARTDYVAVEVSRHSDVVDSA